MTSKTMLTAASLLVIAACGSADEAQTRDATAMSEESETAAEGSAPMGQAASLEPEVAEPDLSETTDPIEPAAAAPEGEAAVSNLVRESERIAEAVREETRIAGQDAGDRAEALGAEIEAEARAGADAAREAADDADAPVRDRLSAAAYTARNTDAYLAGGDLVTGTEAALLAGAWQVEIDGQDEPKLLYVNGEGDTAVGTFDGEPIRVTVTGRNFAFDAPVAIEGEEALMTFAGTVDEDGIDDGVVESQGDGESLGFTATRVEGG